MLVRPAYQVFVEKLSESPSLKKEVFPLALLIYIDRCGLFLFNKVETGCKSRNFSPMFFVSTQNVFFTSFFPPSYFFFLSLFFVGFIYVSYPAYLSSVHFK